MKLAVCLIVAAGTCTLLVGCDQIPVGRQNQCPSSLRGIPSETERRAQLGSGLTKVEANIASVAIECMPEHHPAIETTKARRESFTDYQIACTATIEYRIIYSDPMDALFTFPNLSSTIIFEAVSKSGVVLGSNTGYFTAVKNLLSATVSATIRGLSEEAIHRVVAVHARWQYGR